MHLFFNPKTELNKSCSCNLVTQISIFIVTEQILQTCTLKSCLHEKNTFNHQQEKNSYFVLQNKHISVCNTTDLLQCKIHSQSKHICLSLLINDKTLYV